MPKEVVQKMLKGVNHSTVLDEAQALIDSGEWLWGKHYTISKGYASSSDAYPRIEKANTLVVILNKTVEVE